jgi:hypothetical protein
MWCIITKLSQCLAFAGAVEQFFQLSDPVVALVHPDSGVDDVLLDFLQLFWVVVSILEIKLILIVLLLVVLKHVQLLAECPIFGQDLIYLKQGWHIHETDVVELAEDPGSRLRLPCSLKVEHLQPGQLLFKAHECVSCIQTPLHDQPAERQLDMGDIPDKVMHQSSKLTFFMRLLQESCQLHPRTLLKTHTEHMNPKCDLPSSMLVQPEAELFTISMLNPFRISDMQPDGEQNLSKLLHVVGQKLGHVLLDGLHPAMNLHDGDEIDHSAPILQHEQSLLDVLGLDVPELVPFAQPLHRLEPFLVVEHLCSLLRIE